MRRIILVVTVLLITISPAFNIQVEGQEEMARSNARTLVKVVPFAFVSHIGGMVGGRSAVADTIYVSHSGLIQISKEDTDGVLHSLMIAHADTSKLFEEIIKNSESTTMKKLANKKRKIELPEYYPPHTVVAYFADGGKGSVYEYFEEAEYSEEGKKFIDIISQFVAKKEITHASPGLYMRSQRDLTSDLHLIKFDLELEQSDLLSLELLKNILENEMALIHIHGSNENPVLTKNVVIKAGNPLHIKLGRQAYLIFPYRYDRQDQKK